MTRPTLSSPPHADTRYGKIKIPDLKNDLIGRFLSYYGEWAFNEVRFCASLLKDEARILDIGAFVGTFSLGVASLRRLSALSVVEGNPDLIPFLSANIELAENHPEISVINAIVGPRGYEAHGHYGQAGNLGSTSFVYDETIADLPDDVPAKSVLTLSEIRNEHGPFDLIKIDAEGMELAILSDDKEFVASGASLIWIECNEEVSSLDCADLMLDLGLDIHYFAFPAHNRDNYHGQVEPLMPWAYEAGLLASRHQTIPSLDEALSHNLCILQKINSREELRRALWETPRWAPPEWPMTSSSSRVSALASRQLLQQSYETFLTNDPNPAARPEAKNEAPQHQGGLHDRLEKAEEGLEFARKLALERLDELHKTQAHVHDLEAALEEARSFLNEARKTEIAVQTKLATTEAALAESQTMAFERMEELKNTHARNQELDRVLEETRSFLREARETEIAAQTKLAVTEAALAESQTIAFERMDELRNALTHNQELGQALEEARSLLEEAKHKENAIRNQLTTTEAGLAVAQKLAFERLAALNSREG